MCLLQIGEMKRMRSSESKHRTIENRDIKNGEIIKEMQNSLKLSKMKKKSQVFQRLRYNLIDLLPKFSSIVMWKLIGILLHLGGILGAQTIYPSTQVEIVGYRIVMSDEMGCWSELEIINENRFIDEKTKDLIVDKIAKYELYGRSGGESPMLEVKEKSGRISHYHIVKLPSDTRW